MHRIILRAALFLACAAAPTAAQEAPVGRLLLEPYAGAFSDSYDISPDGEKTGAQLGLRLGYDVGRRTRVLADVGYANTRNVSNPNGLESYFLYDNTWAITTVGAEYDVVAGRTSVGLGLRAGAGWRRNDRTGQVGTPPAHTDWYGHDGFSAIDVVVPSITLRHQILSRTGATLGLQHHIFDVLEGPTQHSPAITFGLSLR